MRGKVGSAELVSISLTAADAAAGVLSGWDCILLEKPWTTMPAGYADKRHHAEASISLYASFQAEKQSSQRPVVYLVSQANGISDSGNIQ